MAATDVTPTRMELIKTKDRITLAVKGHKLLKQKRDALILEFFKILKKARDLRGELAKRMAAAYKSVERAGLYHSISEIQTASVAVRRKIDIDVDVKNVMGVKIPAITASIEQKHFLEFPAYSVAGTSAKIDSAVQNFSDVITLVITLAETETAMKRLIMEIEKTKRRVNALEFIIMPRLEEQKKMISFRLDEMERDSFVSLKTIKRRLERQKIQGG